MPSSPRDSVEIEDVTDDDARPRASPDPFATRIAGVPSSDSRSMHSASNGFDARDLRATARPASDEAMSGSVYGRGGGFVVDRDGTSEASASASGEMTFLESLEARRRASGATGTEGGRMGGTSREERAAIEASPLKTRAFAESFRSIEMLVARERDRGGVDGGGSAATSPERLMGAATAVPAVAVPFAATPFAATPSPDKVSEAGSWSFPSISPASRAESGSRGDVARFQTRSVASPEKRDGFVSPPLSVSSTPKKAPWTPSPPRTPLGTRIPPNSPASERTRKNLEAQMRRAAAWASGEDTLVRRGVHKQGVNKIFEANRGLGAKLYRLLIACGHVKGFLKTLDSARVERAHGGGAKLAIIAVAANCGIQAAHNALLALSAALGERFLRRIAVPQALARRAAPLLLPATLASMGQSNAEGTRGAISTAAAKIVPPISLLAFAGSLWPIRGGQLVGNVHETRGMLHHDVFLDALPWVNAALRRLQPVTNTLAILASYELVSSGEVHAENGGLALALATVLSFAVAPPTNKVTVNFREVRAATNLVFLLSLSHAECAWRETSVWQRYLVKRQGGLEGVKAVDRERGGALAGLGAFSRVAARLPRLGGRDNRPAERNRRRDRHPRERSRRPERPTKKREQRGAGNVAAEDGVLERVLDRLPVIGPVLVILSGFVF